jgi:uncharacterized metal-binding protein
MASGRNHDRAIYFATPIVFGIGASYFGIELGLIAGAAHYVGGLMLSPDLDLVSRPYKRWGLLRFIWLPYQRLIPRHRHWLSHGPVIGSAVRLVYLAAWLSPVWFLFPGLQQTQWSGVTLPNAMAFFCGVELSALNHLLLDGLLIPLPRSVKRRLKGD